MAAPGWIDIRKNLRQRCCWQHNKTRAFSTHEFAGLFAFQWSHESVDAVAKVPNQARLRKINGAEFHFGFQVRPAVMGKVVAGKKLCEKRAEKKRDCEINSGHCDGKRHRKSQRFKASRLQQRQQWKGRQGVMR